MSTRYDCRDPQMRTAGIDAAVTAARGGELIVLPTDTVYGIGADAFTPAAVTTMLAAKGRGRNLPPPVLVGTARAASALVDDLGAFGQDVLKQTGPLAVSSANRHGQPSAISADEAEQQLGEAVSIYLDGGPCADNVPSTILDLTGVIPKVLRAGAVSVDRLRTVASVIAENEHYADGAEDDPDFKPAAPHPLEDPAGAIDPATGEPPSPA